MAGRAAQTPGIERPFFTFETRTPQIYPRHRPGESPDARRQHDGRLPHAEIYLGSSYVNDFNFLGKTFRVTAQADQVYRNDAQDILRLRVRNDKGDNVPIAAFAQLRETAGSRPRAALQPLPRRGNRGHGAGLFQSARPSRPWSRSRARCCRRACLMSGPASRGSSIKAGDTGLYLFALAVVFVFLVLAAQYESLTLPLAVILIVPMCLLAGVTGVTWRGLDENILTQIGFVVLIGLAAKNAILIVEFAKQLEEQGASPAAGGDGSARLRLRPIVMTSLAFILGVAAAGDRTRRGRRDAPGHRHRGVLRNDRRNGVRAALYTDLLRDQPLARPAILAPAACFGSGGACSGGG